MKVDRLSGSRIGVGERMSGWVAANRRSIANSDPALDFGDLTASLKPPLRFGLIVPVENGDELVGVVSFYGPEAFTKEHERLCREFVADIVRFKDPGPPLRLNLQAAS